MADKVIVGCKLPNGIFLDVTDNDGVKRVVKLRGTNEARIKDTNMMFGESAHVAYGAGFTQVDADFWAAWEKENQAYQPYVAGLIFAQPRNDSVRSEARDRVEFKSGLEPIDPVGKDPRRNQGAKIDELNLKSAVA